MGPRGSLRAVLQSCSPQALVSAFGEGEGMQQCRGAYLSLLATLLCADPCTPQGKQ